MKRNLPTLLTACLVTLLIAVAPANACSVPTFRYWLERLEADLYPAVIFHREATQQEALKLARQIEDASTAEPNYANIRPILVNLDTTEDELMLAFYKARNSPELPYMAVFYPALRQGWGIQTDSKALLEMPSIWSGKPSSKIIEDLLDSPLRRRIVRGILSGDSVVFLFIPGKDKDRNEEIRKLFAQHLPKVHPQLQLPRILPQDMQYLSRTGPPMHIALRYMELPRKSLGEEMFLSMIRKMDPKLYDLGGPLVVTIFARGRAVPPIPDEQITQEILTEMCYFFTGECSCEYKGQLPGVDLLMKAGWAHYMASPDVRKMLDKNLPLLKGRAPFETFLVDDEYVRKHAQAQQPQQGAGTEDAIAADGADGPDEAANAVDESADDAARQDREASTSQAPENDPEREALRSDPLSSSPDSRPDLDPETQQADASLSPMTRNLLLAAGTLVVLVILGSVAYRMRKQREEQA